MKLTFIRHAESVFNATKEDIIDCDITLKGISQANSLLGHYDIVIISPLLRTKRTLEESKITYDKLITSFLVREFIQDYCDILESESFKKETEKSILERIDKFNEYLKNEEFKGKNIAIICHSDFIWYYTSSIKNGIRFGIHPKNTEKVEYVMRY